MKPNTLTIASLLSIVLLPFHIGGDVVIGLDRGGSGLVFVVVPILLVMDLPGVPRDSVQVVLARGTVLIAGTKLPAACGHKDAAFHLAERTFGRFARIVRLGGAIDGGRATATLKAGELRIEFPRIEERRGRQIRIPIGTD